MISVILVILCSSLQSDTSQAFYSKITSDFTRHSYYLAFDVAFTDYQGRIIVENDDLYSFFNQDGSLTREKYQEEIVRRLMYNDFTFQVKFPDKGFVKVNDVPVVNKAFSKGKENFIKTYFKKTILKKRLSEQERAAVINKLFILRVASKMEDETGTLIIRFPAK